MRLLRWVLGFLAVSVLALALVVVFRTSIAERLAPVIADDLGIPLNAITVSEIGLDRVVVRDVALGRDRVLRIGQATLEFDALEGTATLASIQDVRLRLEPFGDGPPLGSLQPLIAGGGSRLANGCESRMAVMSAAWFVEFRQRLPWLLHVD